MTQGLTMPPMKTGLITVIIPTYNRASMVEDALESIRSQNYRPIQVVIVDDGSSDSTVPVVRDYIAHRQDDLFEILLIQQANRGAPVARNAGLRAAQGEFIQYLDSDDWIEPLKFAESVAELIAHPNVDFVYTKARYRDQDGKVMAGLSFGGDIDLRQDRIIQLNWTICGPLYRRHVCMKVGPWNEDLRNSQDWEYSCRIKILGFQGKFIDRFGSSIRVQHDGRIGVTGISAAYNRSKERAYDAVRQAAADAGHARAEFNRHLQRRYVELALNYGAGGDALDGARALEKARSIPSTIWRAKLLAMLRVANTQPLSSLMLRAIHTRNIVVAILRGLRAGKKP